MSKITEHELLADHCRFRVGGPADYFTIATSIAEVQHALDFATQRRLRYFVYAGGSNLFFDDAGFRGLVIKLENGGFELDPALSQVTVSAGYDLGALARELADHDLGGIEFLANIPGSIGGAVVGNAGCYGQAIADVLVQAEVLDTTTNQLSRQQPDFFAFAYRHSSLKLDPRYILASATLQLVKRPGEAILAEVTHELNERLGKHPHEAYCAGSFFKNPSRERPAWKVITEAGLAKASVGGAALSERHANFLINIGSATSSEILELVALIQLGVKQKLGLELIPEARYVGPEGILSVEAYSQPG